MKKIFWAAISFSTVFVIGILFPIFLTPELSPEHDISIFLALEPFGGIYEWAKPIEKPNYLNRCTERGLIPIFCQTYTWMMIKGPIVELCVYPDDSNIVKSAGMIEDAE